MDPVALVLLVVVIAGLVAGASQLVKKADAERLLAAAGARSVLVRYEGGHPEMPQPGDVALARDASSVVMASATSRVAIPVADIQALTLDSNVQNVQAGGGRSIGGAALGLAIAGPIGALVGARSKHKIAKIDESKTYMVVRYGNMQVQLIFAGGSDTYAKISPLLVAR